jgi:transcription initiation factor TFIIH subunit 4
MQSILDFIATQSSAVVNKIYGSQDESNVQSPWACKAVFQSLSALSKNIVMRLIFFEGAISVEQLEEWMTPDSIPIFRSSVESLLRLRILEELGDDIKRYRLNPYFRSSLKHALCHPIDPWSNTPAAASLKPDKKPPTKEELDKFSADKWEDVLRFMVNLPTMDGNSVGSVVVNFLRGTNYMSEDGKRGLVITAEGYEYMLKDRRSQVSKHHLLSYRYYLVSLPSLIPLRRRKKVR